MSHGYINLPVTGGGGTSDSFTIFQPDFGTSPTATSPTSVASFTSSGGRINITGNSVSNELDFNLSPANISIGPITLSEDFNCFDYPDSNVPFGPMNLSISGVAMHSSPTMDEDDRYGIAEFTSDAGQISGFSTDTTPLYAGASTFSVGFAFNFGSNIPTGAGNSWVASWGTGNSYPTTDTGAYFKLNYLSPNFICVTVLNDTTTETDSGIPYTTNTWYNFKVIQTPTACFFYVDSVLVATNTTNIPVGSCGSCFAQFTQQTGAGVVARCDWTQLSWTPSSPRGLY